MASRTPTSIRRTRPTSSAGSRAGHSDRASCPVRRMWRGCEPRDAARPESPGCRRGLLLKRCASLTGFIRLGYKPGAEAMGQPVAGRYRIGMARGTVCTPRVPRLPLGAFIQTFRVADRFHPPRIEARSGSDGTPGRWAIPDMRGTRDGVHTRSPPAAAGGFYSSDMLTQTVASPTDTSPERKRWDTGSLGDPGYAWHAGRCSHPESPGFRRGLLFKRFASLTGFIRLG